MPAEEIALSGADQLTRLIEALSVALARPLTRGELQAARKLWIADTTAQRVRERLQARQVVSNIELLSKVKTPLRPGMPSRRVSRLA
jgi:hypothetical protein